MPLTARPILCLIFLSALLLGTAGVNLPARAEADDSEASPGLMQHDAREERPERKELREEMQNIRNDNDALRAEHSRVMAECGGDKRGGEDCREKMADMKEKREALHERMATLKKRVHEERTRHPGLGHSGLGQRGEGRFGEKRSDEGPAERKPE